MVDGYLEITPITDEVTVTITGNTDTKVYNGKEHAVTGYTTDVGDKTITVALKEGKAAEAKNADARPAESKAEAKGHENAPAAREAEEKAENSHSGHHHGRVHDAAAVEAAEKLEVEQLARTEQAGRE